MIKDNEMNLGPIGQKIYTELVDKDISESLENFKNLYINNTEFIHEEYLSLQYQFKLEKSAENKEEIVLTHGDKILLGLLKRMSSKLRNNQIDLRGILADYSQLYRGLEMVRSPSSLQGAGDDDQ